MKMEKRNFAFDKTNYLLLLIGVIIITVGFVMMTGPGTTETHFEPDIFSFRRIKLAPAVCFFGFIFVIYAIMHKSKKAKDTANTQE